MTDNRTTELQAENRELERENAELRALARDMWVKHLERMDDCAWCVMDCEDGAECAFLKKMKELGVLNEQPEGN